MFPVSLQESFFLEEALSRPWQHNPNSCQSFAFRRWQKFLHYVNGFLPVMTNTEIPLPAFLLLYGHYF